MSSKVDLFLLAAEASADLLGARLIEALLKERPHLRIAAMAGPKMRALPIETLFPMESLQVMGFVDVIAALPKIARQFFSIRNKILELNPKAVVCIDYPGFNLRLAKHLRKKGYRGQLIHYVCPTVWAWGKKRIPLMAKNLDLLLVLFPFEPPFFRDTSLKVVFVGHPLTQAIRPPSNNPRKLLGLFPGSRAKTIERNLPLQLGAARRLVALHPTLQIAVSIAHADREDQVRKLVQGYPVLFYPPEKTHQLMQESRLALATSGTVTLELALHETPTVVNFAIRPIDLFIAQKILSIDLPFYCIVNIIADKEVFPELFGPRLTEEALFSQAQKLIFDPSACLEGCREVRNLLGEKDAALAAAQVIQRS